MVSSMGVVQVALHLFTVIYFWKFDNSKETIYINGSISRNEWDIDKQE